ncbi:MAG TPA: PAS domain-containing sensor histidine kinase [Candidatus Thermoplasmatota archaeon]|nr:PAS domain-containing sensor histidine kinase [Candidatus Thermoplasmatota archaeon]
MQREPEIVKILREEERLRNLQTKSCSSNETIVTTEDKPVHETENSKKLFASNTKQLNTFTPDQIETIYRTSFEICPFAILVLDTYQRIISWNPYTESFLHKTNEELYLQSIRSLHSPDEWSNIKQKLDHHTGLEQQLETTILLPNNETRDVSILSYVLKKNDGENLGYLYIIQNTSKQTQSKHQIDSLIQYTEDSIYLLDINCHYLMVNNQLLSQLGRSRGEVLGKTFTDFHSSEETKDFIQKLTRVFEQGVPFRDIHCNEGRWYVRTLNPVKDSTLSHTTAVLVISREITEDKKTKEMLLENEKKYRTLFDFSPQTTLLVDKNGTVLDVNERITEWIGYTPNEMLKKNLFDVPFLTKESKKSLKKIFSKRYSIKKIPPFEIELLTKQNTKRLGVVSSASLKDEHGDVNSYLITISEFAKQKHRHELWKMKDTSITTSVKTLNESEKRFQVVLENSLDMIYQLDLKKDTYEYVSPSSVKIIGYSPEEMVTFTSKNVETLIHPEDSVRWNQHLKIVTNHQQKQNTIQSIEYRFNHKSRGYRWMRDTCTTIFDEKNEPISIIGTIEDITDRKKIWEELLKSEEKYRILAETSADGVFTTDSLGRLTYVNPSFEKLCGRRKSLILATPFRNYLLEDSVYFFQQIFIDVRKMNDKIENVELELVAGDGCIIPIEANIAPLAKQEEFGGVVCTIRDITQRREIEDELKKNERLKTEFMNIAAHELRSPVTPIKGYLDLIIHDNESNQKIKNWAKISLRNAERLLKLVNDILDVSRLDSDTMRFDMEKIDLVELLNEIVEDMKPAITNKKLEFRVNIPSPLPHVIGDKNRLSQVLKNLIGNSLKFTDCGYIGLDVEKKDNHILIAVVDTGIGISKDELRKIFTKFYQAYTGEDRNNEGTGLGLFISKEIVKKHNGDIWAESEIGKGSRFIIQLPYIYKMIVDFKT